MGWGSWEGGNNIKKLVYLKSRWGEYKIYCVKFPFKKLSIFEKKNAFHGVGVMGGGQQKKVSVP